MSDTQVVEALVDGGHATAAPPLGPALGPLGLNIGQVIAQINEKTKDYEGMSVPVKVIADTKKKTFEIEIGSPPVASLLKKEAGLKKGGSDQKEVAGNVTMKQVKKVANMKKDGLLGKTEKDRINSVLGTAQAAGITVDGKKVKEL